MIEFAKLKAFITLAKTGSFSKAAELLNTSQPIISIYIKQLEEIYGTKLVDRLGRKSILTKDGEIFLKYATEIVNLEEELRKTLSASKGEISGTLIVGGSNIPGMYIIPKVAGKFLSKYKDVKIITKIGDSKEIIGAVSDGEIELGIVGTRHDERKVDFEPLVDDRLILISKGDFEKDSIKLDELLQLPYIQREQGSGTRKTVETYLKKNVGRVNLNTVAILSSNEAVKEAVKAGVGVSFVSEISVLEELEKGSLKKVDVEGIDIKRSFYLIRRKKRSLSPVSSVFYEFIKEEYRKNEE